MKININNINKTKCQSMTWNTLAEIRYYEIYKAFLREEEAIDSVLEAEIDETINEARNAVYSFNMITAIFKLNELKHML